MRLPRRGAHADEELPTAPELELEAAGARAGEAAASDPGGGPASDIAAEPAPPARTSEPEPVAPSRPPAAVDAQPAAKLRPGRARRPRASPPSTLDLGPDSGPDPLADGRPAALRIAALHLRTGQHALARAQLEALAGRGRLDTDALLDLAEVRWRTGDLAGAGDAANVLLSRGSESVLALVIAAEAVAAAGRPVEARRLSTRALEVAAGPLDPLFAGMPRSMIWPAVAARQPAPSLPVRRGRGGAGEAGGAPSTAAEAFAGGRAALARGDASRAALLLGVAIRLEPGFADDVLRAVAGRDDQPLLALVRGDALRLLGREAEALEAFDRARGRSSGAAATPPAHGGPGLFDDDPAIADDRAR
jgi:tetratricopeptide (TPR) repeat protein